MSLRWTLLCIVACVSEKPRDVVDDPSGDVDDSTTGDCSEDLDCDDGFICEPTVCVLGDRDSFDDPDSLSFSEDASDPDTSSGIIAPPGDIDHFGYDSPGDEWVSIRTVVADGEVLDTVVTLFDPSGAEWAVMDNFPAYPFRVTGFDSVLYAWLPESGTWTVTVQDVTTYYVDEFTEDEWRGEVDMSYEVLVRAAGATSEADTPDDPSVIVDLPDGNTIFTVGVVIESDGDLDHIEVEMPLADEYLEVWASSGNGSTATPRARLFDSTDTLVADKVDIGLDGYLSLFQGQIGTYRVEASSDGSSGNDSWFALYVRTYESDDSHPFFGTNLYELEVEPNDGFAQATALSVGDLPDYDVVRFEGLIGASDDQDMFSFAVDIDQYIGARCWTDRFGSLAELDVELYDPNQALLDASTDPDASDYYVFNAQATLGGNHTLRIVPDSTTAAGPGHYYRCAVFLTPAPQ